MSLSKIAVKRPITTIMILLIIIAFGVLSIFNLKMDMMPNMNIPVAAVYTTYSGAGPEEMVNLITKPLEEVIGTVAGVKSISSRSSNGTSIVMIEFEDSVKIDNAALDVRERVDLIKSILPDGADDPMVLKYDINSMSQIIVGISSENYDLVELKRLVTDRIANRLERQDGVASVGVFGGHEKEITLTLHEDKLRGYGISESQVIQLLMAENRNVPTGSIKQGDSRLQVRVSGEFQDLDEIRNLRISTAASAVYLRDIGTLEETFKENTSLFYMNGQPGVSLSIQKQSTANTVNVSDAVIAEIAKIQSEMPDIAVNILVDPADFIKMILGMVTESAWQGALLAVIILYVFLRNFRTTLIVATAIPTSVIVTFVLMYYANVTLNVMSLGGLALGIGMLVDNSIVVLESIYRKMEEGLDRINASIEGAQEIAMAVTASTLTTVAIFMPITFLGGLSAEIFNEMALTISFSLASSLLVSITFVPMASSMILKAEAPGSRQPNRIISVLFKPFDLFSFGIDKLHNGYEKFLKGVLKRKGLTVFVSFLLVALTLSTLPGMGMNFLPVSDQNGVVISISMPKGSLLTETEKTAWSVVDRISNYPDVLNISWTVGGGGTTGTSSSVTDTAEVTVLLTDKTQRQKSASVIAAEMTAIMNDIPGAKITVSNLSVGLGMYAGGNSVNVDIMGDSFETLSEIAVNLKNLFYDVGGISSVTTSVEEASPQATITVNRAKASMYGISATAVSGIINTAVSGTVATTYKIDGNEFDIRVRQDKNNYDYISDIENILIPAPTGINIPLYELADINVENMPVSISRSGNQSYVTVTAEFIGRDTSGVSEDITKLMNNYYMPDNYRWEFSGASQQLNDTFGSLGYALIIGVFLVYMIMAAQFESLMHPFIVMFSIPIALTGAIFGLFLLGETFTITAFLGLIMLVGIVVNNGIVLVDYINLLIRDRGMPLYEALAIAGPVRLRPILMTTLTTVLALVPMTMTNQQGSEMMRGLSITVVFGLSLSTLVTLVLIPVIYAIISDIKERFNNRRSRSHKNTGTGSPIESSFGS